MYIAYSPDLAPSDYHMFAPLEHTLAQKCFNSYDESVWKGLNDWFASKADCFLAWYSSPDGEVEKM